MSINERKRHTSDNQPSIASQQGTFAPFHDVFSSLVRPSPGLLQLLRSVGARSTQTFAGHEVFTVRQLQLLLVAYTKKRLLFDQQNPLLVHCRDDPLGQVLGVPQFTRQTALQVLLSRCIPVEPSQVQEVLGTQCSLPRKQSTSQSSRSPDRLLGYSPCRDIKRLKLDDSTECRQNVKHTGSPHSSVGSVPRPPRTTRPASVSSSQSATGCIRSPKKRKASPSNSQSGERAGLGGSTSGSTSSHSVPRLRRRASSLSILYSDSGGGGGGGGQTGSGRDYDLTLTLTGLLVADTDTESVYSVQSKETMIVRDSSDDYWFVEDSDDRSEAAFSITLPEHGVSVELSEFELVSEHSSPSRQTDFSSSSTQELVVVLASDEEFWADCESDCDSPGSDVFDGFDRELTQEDQWACETCGERNWPYHGHCERCWAVRPSWLPPRAGKKEAKERKPDTSIETTTQNDQNDTSRFKQARVKKSAVISSQTGGQNESFDIDTEPTSLDKEEPSWLNLQGNQRNSYSVRLNLQGNQLASDSGIKSTKLATYSSVFDNEPTSREIRPIELDSHVEGSDTQPDELKSLTAEIVSNTTPKVDTARIKHTPDKMKSEDLEWATSNGQIHSTDWCDTNPYLGFPNETSVASDKYDIDRFPFVTSTHAVRSFDSLNRVNSVLASANSEVNITATSKCVLRPDFELQSENVQSKSDINDSGLGSSLYNLTPSALRSNVTKLLQTFSSTEDMSPQSSQNTVASGSLDSSEDLCLICLSKPKEASLIHGKSGHQVCCYSCAKRLKRRGTPCPVCRRPIARVIRNFLV